MQKRIRSGFSWWPILLNDGSISFLQPYTVEEIKVMKVAKDGKPYEDWELYNPKFKRNPVTPLGFDRAHGKVTRKKRNS